MRTDGAFIGQLRSEIISTQERRAAYVRAKLVFVVGLLGAGAISIEGEFRAAALLYIVPLVTFVFDLYVMGEDFAVQRIALFIKSSPAAPGEEKAWETLVRKRKDWYSYLAGPLSSAVALAAAAIGITAFSADLLPFRAWLGTSGLLIIFLLLYRPLQARSLRVFAEKRQLSTEPDKVPVPEKDGDSSAVPSGDP